MIEKVRGVKESVKESANESANEDINEGANEGVRGGIVKRSWCSPPMTVLPGTVLVYFFYPLWIVHYGSHLLFINSVFASVTLATYLF